VALATQVAHLAAPLAGRACCLSFEARVGFGGPRYSGFTTTGSQGGTIFLASSD
jgi:hypothetical protein